MKRLALYTIAQLLLLGACATPPATFYTLHAPTARQEATKLKAGADIVIDQVSVPELVDRPQFVLRTGAYQVTIDEYSRWAEPLKEQIASVLAAHLARSFPDALVSTSPHWEASTVSYHVSVEVQTFESVPGDTATIAALWTVRYPDPSTARSGLSTVRERVNTQARADLVDAHSRALEEISGDIARAIQAGPSSAPRR